MNKAYINISKEFSAGTFRSIAAKVLKEGGRGFYCNKYNNSPYYKVDTFNLYLNPVNQFTNMTVDRLSNNVADYDTIVIQDYDNYIIYYHLILEKDSAVLLDCRDQKDPAYMKKTFIEKYLPAIEKAFDLSTLK